MSTVWIPQVLRAQTGGQKQLDLAGGSVGEVVTTLVEQFPSLRGQLLTDEGDLNRFVNVYVNGQDVRYLDGLKTPVGERDEVRLPAMATGGRLTMGTLRARSCSSGRRLRADRPRPRPRRPTTWPPAAATATSSRPSGTRRWSRSRG
jgi:molybdopterin converting factor small subunit